MNLHPHSRFRALQAAQEALQNVAQLERAVICMAAECLAGQLRCEAENVMSGLQCPWPLSAAELKARALVITLLRTGLNYSIRDAAAAVGISNRSVLRCMALGEEARDGDRELDALMERLEIALADGAA